MNILKIIGIAIVAVTLILTVKSYRPDSFLLFFLFTLVILLLIAAGTISGLIEKITAEAQKYGIDPGYFSVLIKTIGIAYIAQLGSQICSVAGYSAIASKVDLGGRLVILVTVMPKVIEIIEMVCTFLEVNIS